MKPPLDDGFRHLTNFLADTELDLEALDSCMKTTPDGLTHLINMLVDVVNLQRKALATPDAMCDVELRLAENSMVTVELRAVANAAAPPPTTFSAENNRPPTEGDVERVPDRGTYG